MGTTVLTVERSRGVRRHLRKSPFFTLLGLMMLALAIGGFWPQYFSAITGRAPQATTQFWLIHVHAGLFTGWMLLYVSQATLIMSGQARTHLKIGPWLVAYGFATAAVGLYAAGSLADRLGRRENDSEAAAAFVLFPVFDMVYFAGFLAAAVIYRKHIDLHKRAMLLATFSIAVVGLGRLVDRMGFESIAVSQAMILAPLLIATVYDLLLSRRLYPIVAVGLALHLVRLNADNFTNSEAWLPIGRALVAPFS